MTTASAVTTTKHSFPGRGGDAFPDDGLAYSPSASRSAADPAEPSSLRPAPEYLNGEHAGYPAPGAIRNRGPGGIGGRRITRERTARRPRAHPRFISERLREQPVLCRLRGDLGVPGRGRALDLRGVHRR